MNNAQTAPPVRIGLIIGSTRPGRRGGAVATWVERVASGHRAVRAGVADLAVIDLAEQSLPLLDEPVPALFADYRNRHTRRWSAAVVVTWSAALRAARVTADPAPGTPVPAAEADRRPELVG